MKNVCLPVFIALVGLCFFFLPATAFGIEVKPEDFGAVVDDGNDDSAAIQAAVNRVFEVGGGTILFPSGVLEIRNGISVVPTSYIGADVKLKGNRGSIIEISVGVNRTAFTGGNLLSWTFQDLTIIGKNVPSGDPAFLDAGHVIDSNSVQQTNIIRCQFFGLAVPDEKGIIHLGNTDAKIVDSQFDGSLALYPNGSVILAEDSAGLTVLRSTFLDYANFRGLYLSKTPGYVGNWISIRGGRPLNATGQRRVVIEDSRFDEGAANAIKVEDANWVNIRGISVNVNGASPGKGLFLKNVEHTLVEQSWFGYTANSRPAIYIENIGVLEVNSLVFGGGVYFTGGSGAGEISVKNCPQCGNLPTPTPTPQRTNFALISNGGVASASSEYSGSFPARAVNNGDRKGINWGNGGGWNDTSGSVYPDWVEVSFSGPRSIDEISVITLQDGYLAPVDPSESLTFSNFGIMSFELQFWDGSTWVTVPGGSVTDNDKVWTKVTFPSLQTTKIRVWITASRANYSRIVEIEAWGNSD